MSDPYSSSLVHPKAPINTQKKILKILAGTAAEQLTVTQRFVKGVTISGFKGTNIANGASIWFGFDSSTQTFEVSVGSWTSIDSDSRGWDGDLSKIWIRGTATDGAVVTFQEGIE